MKYLFITASMYSETLFGVLNNIKNSSVQWKEEAITYLKDCIEQNSKLEDDEVIELSLDVFSNLSVLPYKNTLSELMHN